MKFLVLTVTLLAFQAVAVHGVDQVVHVSRVKHGASGNGITTRYWDCCKPSCAWVENSNISPPVASCHQDGVGRADIEEQSGCDAGGTAYMCNNQVAIVVNDTFAYGYAALSLTGGVDESMCCRCFLLGFPNSIISDKQMLVQITNTGDPLAANHFDIAIPGGGNGVYDQGCVRQFGATTFDSINSGQDCYRIPQGLQDGCLFRFDWMKGVANPDVYFEQVDCPSILEGISGCRAQ